MISNQLNEFNNSIQLTPSTHKIEEGFNKSCLNQISSNMHSQLFD